MSSLPQQSSYCVILRMVLARHLYTVFVGTAGGNILSFWRPAPPDTDQDLELENSYLLYGHLGGVVHLSTNTVGDTLVSVGQDKVAKVVVMLIIHLVFLAA